MEFINAVCDGMVEPTPKQCLLNYWVELRADLIPNLPDETCKKVKKNCVISLAVGRPDWLLPHKPSNLAS